MKVTYDSSVDVIWIRLNSTHIVDSDEPQPGMIFDYDEQGNIVGIEIHEASKRLENPRLVEFAETSK